MYGANNLQLGTSEPGRQPYGVVWSSTESITLVRYG